MKKGRLTVEEREYIFKKLAVGTHYQHIAHDLGRAPSTIGREIHRNSKDGEYSPSYAHKKASKRSRTSHKRPLKIQLGSRLYNFIYEHLKKRWSPRQISLSLKSKYKNQPHMQVSHEAIYEYIYIQAKGELKKELIRYLRMRKATRKPSVGRNEKRGKIPDMISISQRPEEVADRIIPGHWEGDLLMGKGHKSAIGTIVERSTRYAILVPLKGLDTETVRKAFANEMMKFPPQFRKSLTYDQGKEMSSHAQFTCATKMQVYFCDPASPWQRGQNENTNRLIRDWYPKGTDFTKVTRKELKQIQFYLNERIRETLGWKCPAEKMNELLKR
jgi:transposase, IS30 family